MGRISKGQTYRAISLFSLALRQRFKHLVVVTLATALASCQSISIDDSFNFENFGTNQVKPGGSVETFGKGNVRISMIVNRTGAAGANATGLAQRNGAAMAVGDLGAGSIKLTILDAKGSPERVRSLAKAEIDKKAKLLIVPGDAASISGVSSVVSPNSPPIIALGATGGQGIYSFLPSAADGLSAGIRYAARGKRNRVLLIAPQTSANSVLNSIKRGLGNSVNIIGIAPYLGAPAAADFVKLFSAKLRRADIVAFAGRDDFIASVAAELKRSARYRKITLVGREDWPASLLSSPALQGGIIATRDTSGTSLIASRYSKTYSQGFSSSAAYAYDVVALASGLVRAKGASGLSRQQINAASGFSGTTGKFRFNTSGNAERLYQISQIENGSLKVVQKSPPAF